MEYEHIVHSFEPVYDKNSEILILGTLPSVKSRENHFYYGHKQTKVKRIFANGNKAGQLYRKYQLPHTGIEAVVLPSTSPANAAWSLDRLCEAWAVIKKP